MSRKFLISFLCLFLFVFGSSLAQHSHDSTSDSSSQETHDHSDDSANTAEKDRPHSHDMAESEDEHSHDMAESDDEHSHDMSESSSEHSHGESMSMTDFKMPAYSVMLAEQTVSIEPIIMADGSFSMGVRLNTMDNGMPQLTVISPSGETVSPMMLHGDSMNVMTFPVGMVEAGIYRVSAMLAEDTLELPVGVYLASSNAISAYLVMAPNPSLSSRGESHSFFWAYEGTEALHGDMGLQRSMAGMQHMTDADELMFKHTHFDDVYDDILGSKPMSNELPISFAMAGMWDVNVSLIDQNETLAFEVQVLNE